MYNILATVTEVCNHYPDWDWPKVVAWCAFMAMIGFVIWCFKKD